MLRQVEIIKRHKKTKMIKLLSSCLLYAPCLSYTVIVSSLKN